MELFLPQEMILNIILNLDPKDIINVLYVLLLYYKQNDVHFDSNYILKKYIYFNTNNQFKHLFVVYKSLTNIDTKVNRKEYMTNFSKIHNMFSLYGYNNYQFILEIKIIKGILSDKIKEQKYKNKFNNMCICIDKSAHFITTNTYTLKMDYPKSKFNNPYFLRILSSLEL